MASLPADPLYAAVELGSDSLRLYVARCMHDQVHVVASMHEPIRLAAGFDADGCLDASTMRRALACLRQFQLALVPWQPCAVRVVATAALRIACNTPAFLPAASAAIGHPVEVIGSEEEGRLVYLGVAGALDNGAERRLVIDIGSGATELVLGMGAAVELVQAFGIGSLRLGLAFFGEAITPTAFDAALASARSRFADAAALARGRAGWQGVYGSCGTVRALAELAGQSLLRVDHLQTLRRRLTQESPSLASMPKPARLPALQLAAGLAMLLALVEELGIEAVAPVRAGLRAGLIRDLHARAQQAAPFPECA